MFKLSRIGIPVSLLDPFHSKSLAYLSYLHPHLTPTSRPTGPRQVLSRRTKNNPVLLGEPGVGKTAIAEGLALYAPIFIHSRPFSPFSCPSSVTEKNPPPHLVNRINLISYGHASRALCPRPPPPAPRPRPDRQSVVSCLATCVLCWSRVLPRQADPQWGRAREPGGVPPLQP